MEPGEVQEAVPRSAGELRLEVAGFAAKRSSRRACRVASSEQPEAITRYSRDDGDGQSHDHGFQTGGAFVERAFEIAAIARGLLHNCARSAQRRERVSSPRHNVLRDECDAGDAVAHIKGHPVEG